MFKMISSLDVRTAAGLLARIALSLEDQGNPAADFILENEEALRSAIVKEVREELGIYPDDESPEVISRMADFLDDRADALIGPLDEDKALLRLAESGDLPTDLYEVTVLKNNAYPKDFNLEHDLICTAIRYPWKEQHYGRAKSQNEPSLISLFAKRFKTKWPYKDFILVVLAARNGMLLTVHNAWRLYPSLFAVPSFASPLEMLQAFADQYGVDISQGDKCGKLLLATGPEATNPITFNFKNDRRSNTLVCFATQSPEPNKPPTRAFVMSIDIDKYKAVIEKMSVPRSEIIDEKFNLLEEQKHSIDA